MGEIGTTGIFNQWFGLRRVRGDGAFCLGAYSSPKMILIGGVEVKNLLNTENFAPNGKATAYSLSVLTDRTLAPSGGSHCRGASRIGMTTEAWLLDSSMGHTKDPGVSGLRQ